MLRTLGATLLAVALALSAAACSKQLEQEPAQASQQAQEAREGGDALPLATMALHAPAALYLSAANASQQVQAAPVAPAQEAPAVLPAKAQTAADAAGTAGEAPRVALAWPDLPGEVGESRGSRGPSTVDQRTAGWLRHVKRWGAERVAQVRRAELVLCWGAGQRLQVLHC